MNKFKIGDRVVVTSGFSSFFRVGNVGTIIRFCAPNSDAVVKFDTGQPGVEYGDGIIYDGSWYVCLQHLEHVPESQENTPWYETEEGKEWLSNQNGAEDQFELEKQKRMPKRGERYTYNGGVSEYILAQPTDQKVCLICLTTGNRWVDPVKVVDPFEITKDEWNQICGGDEFVLVE